MVIAAPECACRCGQLTSFAIRWGDGYRKGQPKRWCTGHGSRGECSISTEVLRAALDDHGVTPYGVALSLGWVDHNGAVDAHRVKRVLGLKRQDGVYRQRVTYETALLMVRGAGLDPVDVEGL